MKGALAPVAADQRGRGTRSSFGTRREKKRVGLA